MVLDILLRETTSLYIESLDMNNIPAPDEIVENLVDMVNTKIFAHNQICSREEKLKKVTGITPAQVGMIVNALHRVVRVNMAGNTPTDNDYLLAVYNEDKGIYEMDDDVISRLIRKYRFDISGQEEQNIINYLKAYARKVNRTVAPNLIPLNNGVFNYDTKILEPFSPDYVFLSKAAVDYNVTAKNVIIKNPDGSTWDIESWMQDFYDEPEMVELLWQVVAASVRTNHKWDKAVWFLNTCGNNGKGTLISLMRNLAGVGTSVSIPIADFSKEFALEPLIKASLILVDENDVGGFIDKAANFKTAVTNDVISINRKNLKPISYKFHGFMVQCCNEKPRFKDKSNSLYRRLLVIPFLKSFEGVEKKYIKDDYLKRKDVLEYVMYKVLNMNFSELSEPQLCKDAIEDYMESNNPVLQYWDEIGPELVWDLVPYTFLYEIYKVWMKKNVPGGSVLGRNSFMDEIRNCIRKDSAWSCPDGYIRVSDRMSKPEPLIAQYDLVEWKSPDYNGGDPDKVCIPRLKDSYRGIVRV